MPFFMGISQKKVYMKQPLGFRSPKKPDHVCCLTKAIYGLKQAPRAWYSALKQALLEFGFINAKSNSSLFVFYDGSILAYCLVYVDDLILTGNNSTFVASIIDQLGQKFSIKDLGSLHFFLGVEVIGPQALPTLLKAISIRKGAYPSLIVHSPKRPQRTQRELMDAVNPLICQQRSFLPQTACF